MVNESEWSTFGEGERPFYSSTMDIAVAQVMIRLLPVPFEKQET